MYLKREAESFQARFRETADELITELTEIRELTDLHRRELEATQERLVEVHELTDQAAGAAEESFSFAEGMSVDLGRVEGLVEDLLERPRSSEEVFAHLRLMRSQVLVYLGLVTDEALRNQIAEIVEPIMDRQPRVFDYLRNLREEAAWHEFLATEMGSEQVNAEALVEAARAVVRSREEPDRQTIREDLENAYFKWWQKRQG